jgi:hypothetical protein
MADGSEALLLRGRARLFRAWAFELRQRPIDRRALVADLEGARQDGIDVCRQIAPASWMSADGGLTEAVKTAPPRAVAALIIVAWADELLGPQRDTVAQLRLLREQAAVSGRAVELDPLSEEGAPASAPRHGADAPADDGGGQLRPRPV